MVDKLSEPKENPKKFSLDEFKANARTFLRTNFHGMRSLKNFKNQDIENAEIEVETEDGELVGNRSRVEINDADGRAIELYENPARVKIKGQELHIWFVFDTKGYIYTTFQREKKHDAQIPSPFMAPDSRRNFLKKFLYGIAGVTAITAGIPAIDKAFNQKRRGEETRLHQDEEKSELLPMNKEIRFIDNSMEMVPSFDGKTFLVSPGSSSSKYIDIQGQEITNNPTNNVTIHTQLPVYWFDAEGKKIGESRVPFNSDSDSEDSPYYISYAANDFFNLNTNELNDEGKRGIHFANGDVRAIQWDDFLESSALVATRSEDGKPTKIILWDINTFHELRSATLFTSSEGRSVYPRSTQDGSILVEEYTEDNSSPEIWHIFSTSGEEIFRTQAPDFIVTEDLDDLYFDVNTKTLLLPLYDGPVSLYMKTQGKEWVRTDPASVPNEFDGPNVAVFGDRIYVGLPDASYKSLQLTTFDFQGKKINTQLVTPPGEPDVDPSLADPSPEKRQWIMKRVFIKDGYVTFTKDSGSIIHIPFAKS